MPSAAAVTPCLPRQQPAPRPTPRRGASVPDRSLGTELDAGLLYAMTHVIPKVRFKSQGCASDRAMLATSDAAGASRSNVARLGPTAPALFGRSTALRTYVRAGLPLHDHRARPGTAVARPWRKQAHHHAAGRPDFHTLRELGDDALAPPAAPTQPNRGSAATRRASSGSPRPTNPPATDQATGALAA